ncbi:MAG: DUF937 domain-containing protein [candidate division KSB1 bacterium]|jgi:hypothetical protein|nr:DUF937 domain-containing protein [candidate division KSB1 bacterium]
MSKWGGEVSREIGNKLGISSNVVAQIIPQVVPLILSGLRKQKDERGGEARVDHILNEYGSASFLQNIAGLVAQKATDPSADPQLGGLLGPAGVQATQAIARQFKLDPGVATKLIPMVTPFVLAALRQKRATQKGGSSAVAALLDREGDGNILDDAAGFLMKGLMGGSGSRGGAQAVGNVLSSLFGKKKQ